MGTRTHERERPSPHLSSARRATGRARWRGERSSSRGQALVEFALVIPVVTFILLGVLDMSRVFTSILTIESAAREAADFGAFNSSRWLGAASDPTSNHAKTIAGMNERACVASSKLEDYAGSGPSCTNPDIEISLDPRGGPAASCDQADRAQGPCLVQVDMTYAFDLIVPFGFEFFGEHLGLPDQLTVERTSIFAISDFSVDET